MAVTQGMAIASKTEEGSVRQPLVALNGINKFLFPTREL